MPSQSSPRILRLRLGNYILSIRLSPMPAPKVGSASTIALTEFVQVIFAIPACTEPGRVCDISVTYRKLADQAGEAR
jgi:hypothetical protein